MQLPNSKPSFMSDEEWKKLNLANIITEAIVQGFGKGFRDALDTLDNEFPELVKKETSELLVRDDVNFDIRGIEDADWTNAFKEVIGNIDFSLTIDNLFNMPQQEQSIVIKDMVKDNRPEVTVKTPFGSIHVKW